MKVKALSLVITMLATSYSPILINNQFMANNIIGNALNFDKTYVLDDLYSANNFNIQDYYVDLDGAKKHPEIINFTEYCFDKNLDLKNYSLYFYLYNPQLINFNYESSLNKIQFSISNHSYYKYGVELLSKSDDNRFLKFKIKLDDSSLTRIKEELNVDERLYNVSGIELLKNAGNNAYDYFASGSTKKIGGTYRFTGFSKGYGSEESTLKCDVKNLEVLKLNVKDLWKRYDDATISFKKTQVNSVYFSVPESYFETYGNLKSIDFEYYKFRTAPIFVLRSDVYKLFKDYVGKTWSDLSNPGYTIYGQYSLKGASANVTFPFDVYGENNNRLGFNDVAFPEVNKLIWLFNGGSTGLSDIKSQELKSYMISYNKSYADGKNYKGYSNDLFQLDAVTSNYKRVSVYDNDIENILKADTSFWGRFFNKNDDLEYKCLEEVDYKSINAEDLLIDESLIDDFKTDCNKNKANNERTYILRFDNTPYYTAPVYDKKLGDPLVEGIDGYVCQEFVYLDFDIIDLTFSKQGIYRKIAVVSNPIDIITDIEAPKIKRSLLDIIFKILKIVFLILSIVGIVWLVFKSFNLFASMKILLGGNKTKKKKKKK